MSSRPSRSSTARGPDTADFARKQLVSLSETTSTVLHSWEMLQQVQQQTLQRMALLHEQTASKLRSTTHLGELMAIQSSLIMSGTLEAARYAQELMIAGMRAQQAVAAVPSPEPSQVVPEPGSNPAEQMFHAWQSLFTMPLNGLSSQH